MKLIRNIQVVDEQSGPSLGKVDDPTIARQRINVGVKLAKLTDGVTFVFALIVEHLRSRQCSTCSGGNKFRRDLPIFIGGLSGDAVQFADFNREQMLSSNVAHLNFRAIAIAIGRASNI
jgi:hypothetical protein